MVSWINLLLRLPESGAEVLHLAIRKMAHFTEFACLGALFAWLFGMLRKPMVFALACGFGAASMDETIQSFVPNRGPSFVDVLIDTSGALVGILFLFIGYTACKKILEDKTS